MPINPLQLPAPLREPNVDWSRLDMIGDAIIQGQQNARVGEILGGGPVGQPQPAQQQPMPAMPGGQLPRGLRNNNPGNIEDGPLARSLPGYAGSDGRFAKFDNPDNGLNAMDALLTSYGRRGLKTVRDVISRWAPASDGNNVENYARYAGNGNPDAPVDLSNMQQRRQLAVRMAQFENGMAPPAATQQPAAAGGMPPDVARKIQALFAIGTPRAIQAAQFLQSQYEREADRSFRREEAGRAQSNADRSFGLQQQQFNLTKQQAEDAARGYEYREIDVDGEKKLVRIHKATGKVDMPQIAGQEGGGAPNPYAVPGKQNDEQAKAALYSRRMFQAERVLRNPAVMAAATSVMQQFGGAVGNVTPLGLGRGAMTAEFQQYDQAKRDFVNAVLRRESGAVISEAEFVNADKQYFPLPGDDEKTLKQKQQNREEAIRGITAAAGRSYAPEFVFGEGGAIVPNPRARGAQPGGAVPWQQYFGNR